MNKADKSPALAFFDSKKCTEFILLFAIVVQVLLFIYYQLTNECHADEAMLILNARSIADNGTDVLGNKMPVYFNTWLYGGQSPFPTYVTALFIKLFGYRLWLTRLPVLLLSFASLVCFERLLKNMFKGNLALANIIFVFYAIQPWRLFQSVWTFDCAYMPYLFVIGAFFLDRAVQKSSRLLYVFSMLFFALAIYSYIAAVLIIPVFLVVYFLFMLKKGRVKLFDSIFSAFVFVIFLTPFVLYGFAQLGIVSSNSFPFLQNNAMKYYSRSNDTIFSLFSSPEKIPNQLLKNTEQFFIVVLFGDVTYFAQSTAEAYKMNTGAFFYGHFVSTALILLCVYIFISRKKRSKLNALNTSSKAFLISMTAAFIFFILSSNDSSALQSMKHRFAVFCILFNILSGIGAYALLKISKGKLKAVITVVILSLASISLTFYGAYNFTHSSDMLSVKGMNSAVSYLEDNGYKSYAIDSSDELFNSRASVYLRYLNYDEIDEFEPLFNELVYCYKFDDYKNSVIKVKKDSFGNVLIKSDSSIKYVNLEKEIYSKKAKALIVDSAKLKKLSAEINGYTAIDFGSVTVLVKQ